jgi:hypothetical protein
MPVSTSTLSTPAFMPKGWPVAVPELLMGYVGPVLAIRIGATFSAAEFARYTEEWARSVDARPDDAAVFALYDVPVWPGMTAVQRREWGTMLKSHEGKLRLTTRGMALASPSALMRGSARAIFWLAPPPYPHAVVDTPRAAFEHIETLGGPPGKLASFAYDTFVRQHWREAKP